jgi:heme exporter protein A
MLEAINLCAIRGDLRLFRDIGFRLEAGELLYLHGHNGSGKTTLLRTLCGLILPDEGEVRWDGKNIRDIREDFAEAVFYLGHKNAIKSELTAIENLRISSLLDGQGISEDAAWAALKTIGLDGHEDLPAKVLSQGQKRRVALARLIVNQARLWVLDEPFTALDKGAVELLQGLIRGHLERGGMAVLTTHQEVPLTSGHAKTLELGWKNQHREAAPC